MESEFSCTVCRAAIPPNEPLMRVDGGFAHLDCLKPRRPSKTDDKSESILRHHHDREAQGSPP